MSVRPRGRGSGRGRRSTTNRSTTGRSSNGRSGHRRRTQGGRRDGDRVDASPPLAVYVEGPQDRGILRAWAYRFLPAHVRLLSGSCVILGGRQPGRAIEHFRRHLADAPGSRALCVLDRDGGEEGLPDPNGYDLSFFTWTRRHIESYLLVPDAIRRALGLPEGDRRVERLLERELPGAGDHPAWQSLDAKRLLAPGGALPRALGRPLPLARIARVTREPELHADVHDLFERVSALFGLSEDPRPGS